MRHHFESRSAWSLGLGMLMVVAGGCAANHSTALGREASALASKSEEPRHSAAGVHGEAARKLSAQPGSAGVTNRIMIDNFTFEPPTLTIPVGAKVTWVNRDDVPHTATSTAKP